MAGQVLESQNVAALRRKLLAWYEATRRNLPWRHTTDPYAIWVSDIMLQQTRVAAVVERYQEFLARFPTVPSLAQASEQDVLALWSGLGYYRRARMLHKAAQRIAEAHSGQMPKSAAELRTLPGIGAYTAAAVASIAYGERVAVVDGNVERVLCRLSGWEMDGSAAIKRKVAGLAEQLVDPRRPGDFNQAMMELGAIVCLPRNPKCLACPLVEACRTRGEHKTQRRPPMQSRELARALVLRVRRESRKRRGKLIEEVLLEQRLASESVMPGLWELPALRSTNVPEDDLRMTVRHSIMQVNYSVRIRSVPEEQVEALTLAGGERRWVSLQAAAGMALTGLARKVLRRAHLLSAARQ